MSFIKRLSLQKLRKNSSSSPTTSSQQQPQAPHVELDQQEQEQLPLPLPSPEEDIVMNDASTTTTDMKPSLPPTLPEKQTVLLLHAPRTPYQLTEDYPVPQLEGEHDVLVRTQAIGLNPIDWKAP